MEVQKISYFPQGHAVSREKSWVLNPGLTYSRDRFFKCEEGAIFAISHNFLLNVAPAFVFQMKIAIPTDQQGSWSLKQGFLDPVSQTSLLWAKPPCPAEIRATVVSNDKIRNCTLHGFVVQCSPRWGIIRRKICKPWEDPLAQRHLSLRYLLMQ